jgi:hypothetical protein
MNVMLKERIQGTALYIVFLEFETDMLYPSHDFYRLFGRVGDPFSLHFKKGYSKEETPHNSTVMKTTALPFLVIHRVSDPRQPLRIDGQMLPISTSDGPCLMGTRRLRRAEHDLQRK